MCRVKFETKSWLTHSRSWWSIIFIITFFIREFTFDMVALNFQYLRSHIQDSLSWIFSVDIHRRQRQDENGLNFYSYSHFTHTLSFQGFLVLEKIEILRILHYKYYFPIITWSNSRKTSLAHWFKMYWEYYVVTRTSGYE